MFFLLRMAFWIGVVCVLLPGKGSGNGPDAQIDTAQAVTLASAAVSDARGFCERQPGACEAGGKVFVALGHKAEAGARTIYEFVSGKIADGKSDSRSPDRNERTASASAPAKIVPVSAQASGLQGGTLTPADMSPIWHAPVPLPPRREARNARPAA